jgi:hypothetical membrane protein
MTNMTGETVLEFLKTPLLFQILSFAGATFAVLGSVVAGIAYRGRLGETYSPFNHYISELGEVGISRLAWVFNAGLILCGACLLLACINLGLILPGVWSKIGMVAGMIAAISLSLVGVFPMNDITSHMRVAVTYFRMGLVMIFCFTAAIALQPQTPLLLPRLFSLAGLPAILSFTYFLTFARAKSPTPQALLAAPETARPRFWLMALAEWAIFLTTVPWLLIIALGFRFS